MQYSTGSTQLAVICSSSCGACNDKVVRPSFCMIFILSWAESPWSTGSRELITIETKPINLYNHSPYPVKISGLTSKIRTGGKI